MIDHFQESSPRKPGRVPLLSADECREIAAAFDGKSPTIDALLRQWQTVYPGLQRHNVVQAARRGGYRTTSPRKPWTASDDQFLRDHWHQLAGEEIARCLGRSFDSVNLRRKRLRIGRSMGGKPTAGDHGTPVDKPLIRMAVRSRVSAQDNPWLSTLGWLVEAEPCPA